MCFHILSIKCHQVQNMYSDNYRSSATLIVTLACTATLTPIMTTLNTNGNFYTQCGLPSISNA